MLCQGLCIHPFGSALIDTQTTHQDEHPSRIEGSIVFRRMKILLIQLSGNFSRVTVFWYQSPKEAEILAILMAVFVIQII